MKNTLLRKVDEENFKKIEKEIRENFHYLSKKRKRLFYLISQIDIPIYPELKERKYIQQQYHNGKN